MIFHIDDVIHTDVLVIGGGAAAVRAALESARAGAETLLITKGRLGHAGTSCYRVAEAAGFSAAGIADPEDTPEKHYQDILNAGLGPVSKKLARIVAENAPRQVPFLESLGVEFQRFNGGYLATKGCFASQFRSLKIYGHGGPIVEALRDALRREETAQIMEQAMVLELLTEDNVCRGAVVCDGSGRILAVRAGATILGAGGAGRLFALSLNPADVTGDGYALAYGAGAEMVNMEFMQAGFGIVHPALSLFNSWFWLTDPELLDGEGKPFVQNCLPSGVSLQACLEKKGTHYPFSTRDCSKYLEIACVKKHREGGSVKVDLRGAGERGKKENKNFAQMWDLTKHWLLQEKHIDIERDTLYLDCLAHAFNGGALINENAQTTVERLFAVGENCGGPHGADRLGGNMFSSGQVFGQIAGRCAAELSRTGKADGACNAAALPSDGIEDTSGQIREMLAAVQTLATQTLLIVRREDGLLRFKQQTEDIRDRALHLSCRDTASLRRRTELLNVIQTGQLVAEAALMRTESRGSHYREDHPSCGGPEWEKAIVLQNVDGHMRQTKTDI